jgi:carbamate kinase
MSATALQPTAVPATPRRRPIVVALGSTVLLGPGGPAEADLRRRNVSIAVEAIADLAADHDVVVTHGSGLPGMVAYLLEQGLDDALPGRDIATLRLQGVVDATELHTIRSLVAQGVLVICAGGGGAAVVVDAAAAAADVEAVVDRDLAAALLAACLGAEALLMLTDVPAVQRDWGTPAATPVRSATPDDLWRLPFAADSMGPKVHAACRFVDATGGVAAIGALADARALLNGRCGTIVRDVDDRARADRRASRDRLSVVPAVVARSTDAPVAGRLRA